MLDREFTFVQSEFLDMFRRQQGILEMYSSEQLRDISHRAGELKLHGDFSMRVAAEVNFAAAELILEKRK